MNRRPIGLLVAGAMALGGCAAHVALPRAPPPAAPYPVRVQAYNTFRPLAMQYTTTISYSRYGGSSMSTAATGLLLANGARVVYPEDLLPLAGEGSPMANSAREARRVQRIGSALTWSGFGGTLLGAGLVAAGFFTLFTGSSSTAGNVGVGLLLSGVFFAVTAPIPLLVGAGYGGAAARHRETAYQLYDQSLRQNLGLCGDGTQIGDCPAAAAAGYPPGVAPPPPPPGNDMAPVRIGP